MKKSLIILICFFTLLQANSQGIGNIKTAHKDINCADTNINLPLTHRPIPRYIFNKKTYFKNNLNNQLVLDSLIGQYWNSDSQNRNNIKDEFSFDENENLSVNIQKEWDNISEKWVPQSKYQLVYNDKNSIIQEEQKYWSTYNETWIPFRKTAFNYDSVDNLSHEVLYKWDTTQRQWVNNWRVDYLYNENNLLVLELIDIWDTSYNSWVSNWKRELEYDSNLNLLTNIEEKWISDSNIWLIKIKNEYHYIQENTLEYHIFHYRLNDFDPFEPYWKCEYTYDNNGNLSLEYYSEWISDSLPWTPSRKNSYLYYTDGNLRIEKVDFWNIYTNTWYNNDNFEYYYDDNSNLITLLENELSDTTWYVSRKHVYHYDYNTVNYLIPNFEYYPFEWEPTLYYRNITNQPIDKYIYQKAGDSLTAIYRTMYYYSTKYNALDIASESWFKVFPNPAKGEIRILKNKNSEIHGIVLFNQLGQKILNIPNGNYDVIDVSSLNSGLYIIEVAINNIKIRKKIIIKR